MTFISITFRKFSNNNNINRFDSLPFFQISCTNGLNGICTITMVYFIAKIKTSMTCFQPLKAGINKILLKIAVITRFPSFDLGFYRQMQ
jgi:hypothetical protein